jgi:2-phosphoglycerate kinase
LNRIEFNPYLKAILSQVYILGGSPCSGKSTLAEKLSVFYDLQYYNVDDHYQDHVARCSPQQHPTMYKIAHMGWNEIWSRPPALLVQEEFEFYRELFGMILQDLGKLNVGKPVIVEGAALLPELITKINLDRQRVLYMVPTKEFQVYHYAKRPFIQGILKDCDDPQTAFANWMERDHLFGQEIIKQARSFSYGSIIVDGSRSIEDQFKYSSQYYGFS